jgi:peroxiredoxin
MKTLRILAAAAVIVAAIGTYGGRAQPQNGAGVAPDYSRRPMPADILGLGPAPDFTLTDQKGNTVQLSDFKGKVVVLEWTNPDCPFVQRHYKAGTMARLAKTYAGKGVVWLAINSTYYMNRKRDAAWAEQQQIAYPVLGDHDGKVGKAYGAKSSPHMFVIDAKGNIAYRGAIDNDASGEKKEGVVNYVALALDAVLAGKPVAVTETRPYGCSVKYPPEPT